MKKISFVRAGLFSLSACLTLACGSSDKKADAPEISGSLSGYDYAIREGAGLSLDGAQIAGTGSLVFVRALEEKAYNYQLEVQLEDGGAVRWVAFSNASLAQGVGFELAREGDALKASVFAEETKGAAKPLTGLDAAASLSLAVDLHNDETPAHILAWDALAGAFEEGDALLNSEADGDTPGNGKGTSWGLVLSKAKVKAVSLGEPKFKD